MILQDTQLFSQKLPITGKIITLDVGAKIIGIAFCDETQTIASPCHNYSRINVSKDTGYINRIIKENSAVGIVIGLPKDLEGKSQASTEVAQNFANKLAKKNDLPILLMDERFSTSAVHTDMKNAGVKRKDRHAVDDKLAAGYILQLVLDMINNQRKG